MFTTPWPHTENSPRGKMPRDATPVPPITDPTSLAETCPHELYFVGKLDSCSILARLPTQCTETYNLRPALGAHSVSLRFDPDSCSPYSLSPRRDGCVLTVSRCPLWRDGGWPPQGSPPLWTLFLAFVFWGYSLGLALVFVCVWPLAPCCFGPDLFSSLGWLASGPSTPLMPLVGVCGLLPRTFMKKKKDCKVMVTFKMTVQVFHPCCVILTTIPSSYEHSIKNMDVIMNN